MKIVYFYQYFSTPNGSWGTRVYEFASQWVKEGHEVTVVTSVYSKSDLKAVRFLETQWFEGIQVKIINVQIDNKQPILKRIGSFLQYALMSCYYAIRLPADIVIASSGPITVGLPGLAARYLRGRKLVFEARDLWPEGAIELGIIRNKRIQRLAYWFEKKCYNASSLIVALSSGMRDHIVQKHHHPFVIDVTNAANIDMFSTPASFPVDKGLVPDKYAIYTGNIGKVNNSSWLLEAAAILKQKGRSDIKILLIGEGQQREQLEQSAAERGIDNFIRWGLIPKHELVAFIQNALVSLVPLHGTPVLDTSSPNKFFESLAAGVPVIQNTNGWMKIFLEETQTGLTLSPNDPEALANALIDWDAHPEKVRAMGQRALTVARQEFDKTVLADKMLKALIQVHQSK